MTEHPQSMSIYTGAGEVMQEFFSTTLALADLDWSPQVRVLQILRMLKCWVQFARQLRPADFFLPLLVIRKITGGFFRARNS